MHIHEAWVDDWFLVQNLPCWDAVLATMKPQEHAIVTCPPEAAYGMQGVPPRIPGHETVHFDIQVLQIKRHQEKEANGDL